MIRNAPRIVTAPQIAITLCIALALAFAGTSRAEDASGAGRSAFLEIMVFYEDVRQALCYDTIEGVKDDARSIHAVIEGLDDDFSASAAGVAADYSDKTRELLPELAAATRDLAAADDLATARDAFYALSKPLVRYRFGVVGERPVVVYCPMARKSWLQPEGEIGNPYHGRAMPTCGEIVED